MWLRHIVMRMIFGRSLIRRVFRAYGARSILRGYP
jgi:hypothetical protein